MFLLIPPQSYAQYWLDDETCECGPFIIEPISKETPNPDISVRELKLTYQPQVRIFAWSICGKNIQGRETISKVVFY